MRFGILGPLRVWTDAGAAVTVPQTKVRVLLATLLLDAGRPVSADRLVDAVWQSAPPHIGSPHRALHTKVWQLRRALEDAEAGAGAMVESRAPGYRLAVAESGLDATRFRALAARARGAADPAVRARELSAALELWRSDEALSDVPVLADVASTAPALERLHDERLTAVEDRAEALLLLGEHGALAEELAEPVAVAPLRERLRAAHMRALAAAGRRREALDGYDRLRRALAAELGVDPGPEIQALHRSLLDGSPPADGSPARLRPSGTGRALPVPLTPLIGRDAAVAETAALLGDARLVTLTGPGGVGKTRLALAVANAHAAPDGVWLAELGTLAAGARSETAGDVAALVAAAVGLRDETAGVRTGAAPLAERLTGWLGPRTALLVLDNCEHLAEAAATIAERLLRSAPGLRILATSREPLGIAGERLAPVAPLPVPDEADAADPARAARSDAVALFVARVADSVPGFRLDDANAATVSALCRRLDGHPFALELAANRVRALGVDEVAARLDDRFRLLTSGARGAPTRQQTLQATIDWSWHLLTDSERAVLRRLSVHIGGCDLAAAERTCGGDGVEVVLDVVARLVDRSLVEVVGSPHGPRYRLLESVSAYAAERLAEAGETDEVRRRLLDHHVELAEQAVTHLRGPDQRTWLARRDAEAANVRAALDVAAGAGAVEPALRLVLASAWFWFLRGRLADALRAFDIALAVPGDAPGGLRAAARAWRFAFAVRVGEAVPSASSETYRDLDTVSDARVRATARWILASEHGGYGDPATTLEQAERAVAESRAAGDGWVTAAAQATVARIVALNGDLDRVHRAATESAALFAELGDGWGRLQAGDALALLAETRGDLDRAEELHRDGLAVAEALGLPSEVSLTLSGLGRMALLRGDHDRAAVLHRRAAERAAADGFPFGVQFAEVGLGIGYRRQGDLDAAERVLTPWLAWCRETGGDVGAALILAELGFVAELRGDPTTALELHRQGWDAAVAAGDPRSLALALEGMAAAHAAADDPERAATLLGAAAATRARTGADLPAAERADVDRASSAARTALGPERFTAAFERSRAFGSAAVSAVADDRAR